MVASIDDQIHRFLIEQEESRCRALEAEYKKKDETKGKKVKRKTIRKPWARPNKYALCQEIDLLFMVDEYDYELFDKTFQRYCSARGILHVTGEPGSRKWEYMADYTQTKRDYLADPCFQFAQEFDGKRYRYTSEDMETGWKIMRLGRAKLQDGWELYLRESSDQK